VQRVRAYLAEARADYPAAVAAYQQAINLAPELSYLHMALGNAQRARKSYAEALKSYQRALELDPDNARIEAGLGSVYYAQEEYLSAVKHYQRAATLDPRYPTPPGQLGWIYYVQRDYAKAQPYLEQAAELEPQPLRKAQYLHALGWINLKSGNRDQARQDFTQALALDPGLQGARDGLQALGG
jgi:Flp pilus assembly protein TadD